MWGTTWQNQQNECAPSEDLDQPGHPPSLIRVYAVRMKKAWVLSYPLSAQRWLIGLDECPGCSESSLGAHPFCWFCHVAAQSCCRGFCEVTNLNLLCLRYYKSGCRLTFCHFMRCYISVTWWCTMVIGVVKIIQVYRKNPKNADTQKIAVIILKIEQVGSTIE